MKPSKQVREFLAEIGRKGGQIGGKSTSKAKAAAARRNGRLAAERRKIGNQTVNPDQDDRRA